MQRPVAVLGEPSSLRVSVTRSAHTSRTSAGELSKSGDPVIFSLGFDWRRISMPSLTSLTATKNYNKSKIEYCIVPSPPPSPLVQHVLYTKSCELQYAVL